MKCWKPQTSFPIGFLTVTLSSCPGIAFICCHCLSSSGILLPDVHPIIPTYKKYKDIPQPVQLNCQVGKVEKVKEADKNGMHSIEQGSSTWQL